jgi:glycosyltransferase involved in cell wall biosynthesis
MGTPLRVVYAGRLERLKGVHLLWDAAHVAAARLGRPIELRVAGDGPLRPVLDEQSRLASSAVRMFLHGWQTISQRNALLSAADVVAVPSLWPEPFGLVGLEAARYAVPSVGFASGGIPEWLRHGVTGLVSVERTPTALGEAMAAALEDENMYARLSAGALAASAVASPDAHAVRLERLFGECLP